MNEELLKSYEELKKNRNIINTIDPDFFFKIVDCLLKENEELKFEERRRIIGKYGDAEIHDVINKILSNDYIPVQKVKDKIEELKRFIYTGENAPQDFLQYRVKAKIQALQELLEGRK